jgi:hypothetical protein
VGCHTVIEVDTVEAAYYNHLGPTLFDNNNRLITLSGGYKSLHYLTQFSVTTFTCISTQCALHSDILVLFQESMFRL